MFIYSNWIGLLHIILLFTMQRIEAFDALILIIGEILHSCRPCRFSRLLVKATIDGTITLKLQYRLNSTVIYFLRCHLDGSVATAQWFIHCFGHWKHPLNKKCQLWMGHAKVCGRVLWRLPVGSGSNWKQQHCSEIMHRVADNELHDSGERHFAAANSWIVPSWSCIAQ